MPHSLSSTFTRPTMTLHFKNTLFVLLILLGFGSPGWAAPEIRHSYLVLGNKTAIIAEDGNVEWEFAGGTRDGFVLPNGNVLLAYTDRVVEVTREKQVVFTYQRSKENKEIGTTERLANGNTLITEEGVKPRLMEVNPQGEVVVDFPLQPETDNAHMQTRMARKLKNGNYLVPHLLAFAIKEYRADGQVVQTLKTDLEEIGGRKVGNWPFTAIRLENGNTLTTLTNGLKVVELDAQGAVVWKVTTDEVAGLLRDPCGAQRLANGNTVVGSHGANKGVSIIELTREKEMVWKSDHPFAASVHHLQILTTNGQAEPGRPLR